MKNNNLIKIVSPDCAKKLADQGFQYIQEHDSFAFPYSDDIIAFLEQCQMSQYIVERKLRF